MEVGSLSLLAEVAFIMNTEHVLVLLPCSHDAFKSLLFYSHIKVNRCPLIDKNMINDKLMSCISMK